MFIAYFRGQQFENLMLVTCFLRLGIGFIRNRDLRTERVASVFD